MTLDLRPIDKLVYENELCPWLPEKILDCHVHISLPQNCGPISPERKQALWPIDVGIFQSWEDLRDVYHLLFPNQEAEFIAFGGVYREQNIAAENNYVLCGLNNAANKAAGLYVTRPEWDAKTIEMAMSIGFSGIKPYPDLAPQGALDSGIYDFVPRAQLEVLNDLGGVLMMHLPRAGRIGDPDNIRELLEISDRYRSIKLIVAHVGRAYCLPTAEKGLPYFADIPGVYFDISANLNAEVFSLALELIGPDRLMFGSDLPVMLMRGVREHIGENYYNFTDESYSWNTNRKGPDEEANYTFFIYEELKALISAARHAKLGKAALEKILYSNAARLLGKLKRPDSAAAVEKGVAS